MSAAAEVHIVRIIRPARGKIREVKVLVRGLVPFVEQFAPDVLKYQFLESQEGIIISQEIYRTAKAAMDHLISDYYFNFLKMLDEGKLLAKEIETQIVVPSAGFDLRT